MVGKRIFSFSVLPLIAAKQFFEGASIFFIVNCENITNKPESFGRRKKFRILLCVGRRLKVHFSALAQQVGSALLKSVHCNEDYVFALASYR